MQRHRNFGDGGGKRNNNLNPNVVYMIMRTKRLVGVKFENYQSQYSVSQNSYQNLVTSERFGPEKVYNNNPNSKNWSFLFEVTVIAS